VPVAALGGAKGVSTKAEQMAESVGENVAGGVIASSDHFGLEEAPQELALANKCSPEGLLSPLASAGWSLVYLRIGGRF
jgi:hypothetical protein